MTPERRKGTDILDLIATKPVCYARMGIETAGDVRGRERWR